MKKLFALFFFSPFFCQAQHPSAQLVNVEVGKQIGFSGEVGTSREMANLAFFPGFNLRPLADRLDLFLREQYLPQFDISLGDKNEVLENEDFQNFKSPYFQEKDAGSDASGQHRQNSLTGAYSWGKGYVPWTYHSVLTDHYDDFQAITGFFPEAQYLITAEMGFSYIIDSDLSISPVLILEFRRADDGSHKKLHFTTFVDVSQEMMDHLLKMPPDAKRTYGELDRCLEPLFEVVMSNVEHDVLKIHKFLEK